MSGKLLIVDNDEQRRAALEHMLERKGFELIHAKSIRHAIKKIKEVTPSVMLLNFDLGSQNAIELLRKLRKEEIEIPSIVLAQSNSTRKAIRSIKLGAKEYLTYPFQPEELLEAINSVSAQTTTKKKTGSADKNKEVVGLSPAAKLIQNHIQLVAPTEMSVIIQGDTGTGKEFVAREIVRKSRRRRRAFVALDCGAIPKELAGSELFGHKKGSFTGALADKKGSFELANRGTLFLDEIGNLSYQNQIRLLRVLQEGQIKPIGSNEIINVDVRVLAAANDDLWEMVEEGKFREDLYHRLNEFKIELPLLKDRGEDIKLFAQHFLSDANESLNKSVSGFTKKSLDLMQSYDWPGNLREMMNVVKRACLLCQEKRIEAQHLRLGMSEHSGGSADSFDLKEAVRRTEMEMIDKALDATKGNKSEAARLLGIDRKSLYNKLDQYKM